MAGRRAKLTQEMVEQAMRLKADGLSNGDIISALGIYPSTVYRWIGEPRNRLQCELSNELNRGVRVQADPPDHDPRCGPGPQPVLDGGRVAARAQVPRRVRQGGAAPRRR